MNVAIILARGGSKGVPRKNLRLLGDKPLLTWTIEQARAARAVDAVVVSTDDAEIAEVARAAGAEVVMRPASLSGDTATSESGIAHALEVIEHGGRPVTTVVFLQCTSPIRRRDDIDRAYETYLARGADSLLSVSPSHAFLWTEDERGLGRPLNYEPHKRPRRQDMKPQYRENGSIYVFARETFRRFENRLGERVALHVMDEDAAWEIDSEVDFQVVAALLAARGA